MHFEIEAKELRTAINKVRRIPPKGKNHATPIIAHVVFEAGENVVLRVTDLETSSRTVVDGAVKEPGAIAVEFQKLQRIMKSTPKGPVRFTTAGDRVQIETTTTSFELYAGEYEDFPTWPEPEGRVHEIPGPTIAELLKKTMFASSRDQARYNIYGVYFHRWNGKLRAAATDGHRLAVQDSDYGLGASLKQSGAIVPNDSCRELARLVAKAKGNVAVVFGKPKDGYGVRPVWFQAGDETLLVRTVEGDFPNYHAEIPETKGHVLRVETKALAASVGRVAAFTSARYPAIGFDKNGNGTMTVFADNPEFGRASEDIPTAGSREPWKVGLNPGSLTDALKVMESEELHVRFTDHESAFTVEGSEDRGFLYVQMPCRL